MRATRLVCLALSAAFLLGIACGTGAPPAGGDLDLPTSLVGPFRVLRSSETPKTAPRILRNAWYGPTALDLDGDPSTPGLALYVVGPDKPYAVSRFELPDGRSAPSQETQMKTVLPEADGWEKVDGIANPFVLRGPEAGVVWLYYDSGGCIGRAVSTDGGVTFGKRADPLVCGTDDPSAWENGALAQPSVVRLADGSYRLFYASNGRLGEMTSLDGETFRRLPGPVLEPQAASGDLVPDAGSDTFDDVSVGDPDVLLATSADGRAVTYVFYTALNRLGQHAIGLAARFGDTGPITRNPAPVLTRYDPRAPAVIRFPTYALLFTEGPSVEAGKPEPVINGAVAPATFAFPVVPDAGTDAAASP